MVQEGNIQKAQRQDKSAMPRELAVRARLRRTMESELVRSLLLSQTLSSKQRVFSPSGRTVTGPKKRLPPGLAERDLSSRVKGQQGFGVLGGIIELHMHQ